MNSDLLTTCFHDSVLSLSVFRDPWPRCEPWPLLTTCFCSEPQRLSWPLTYMWTLTSIYHMLPCLCSEPVSIVTPDLDVNSDLYLPHASMPLFWACVYRDPWPRCELWPTYHMLLFWASASIVTPDLDVNSDLLTTWFHASVLSLSVCYIYPNPWSGFKLWHFDCRYHFCHCFPVSVLFNTIHLSTQVGCGEHIVQMESCADIIVNCMRTPFGSWPEWCTWTSFLKMINVHNQTMWQ